MDVQDPNNGAAANMIGGMAQLGRMILARQQAAPQNRMANMQADEMARQIGYAHMMAGLQPPGTSGPGPAPAGAPAAPTPPGAGQPGFVTPLGGDGSTPPPAPQISDEPPAGTMTPPGGDNSDFPTPGHPGGGPGTGLPAFPMGPQDDDQTPDAAHMPVPLDVPGGVKLEGSNNTPDTTRTANPTPGDSTVPGSAGDVSAPAPSARTVPNLNSTGGSPRSSLPPVQPPSVQPPSAQKASFNDRPYLFSDLPSDEQDKVLKQGHDYAKKIGQKYSDDEIASAYNSNRQTSLPPLNPYTVPGGLKVTEMGSGGWKAQAPLNNPGSGDREIYDPAQYGTTADSFNKSFQSAKSVQDYQDTTKYASQAIQAADAAQAAKAAGGAKGNPGIQDKALVMAWLKSVDQSVRINQTEESVKQAIGQYPLAQVPQETLEKVLYGESTLTDQARNAIKSAVLQNAKASQGAARMSVDQLAAQAKAGGMSPNVINAWYTGLNPEDISEEALRGGGSSLPPVSGGANVTKPGASSGPVSINSPEQFNQLKKAGQIKSGDSVLWKGKPYTVD